MFRQTGIFPKMILYLLFINTIIAAIYHYSNQKSVKVVEQQISSLSMSRLSFLAFQLESGTSQLFSNVLTVSRDQSVVNLHYDYASSSPYYQGLLKLAIKERMEMSKHTNGWIHDLTLLSPTTGQIISTDPLWEEQEDVWSQGPQRSWKHGKGRHAELQFSWLVRPPYVNSGAILSIIYITFPASNLAELLNQYQSGQNTNPLLLLKDGLRVLNQTSDDKISRLIGDSVHLHLWGDQGEEQVKLENSGYQVYYKYLPSMDGYVVDYVPLTQVLQPILESRNRFYLYISLLLTLSILTAFVLYRHVHNPITELSRKLRNFREGQLSVRIHQRANRDFDYLFKSFNQMAEQMETLIETNYREHLRGNDAMLKHLQSQINPHFLYNCLSFIQNMTMQGNRESVYAMVHHLSVYYRYTTRLEKQSVMLREEMNVVKSYLQIQNLRWNCIVLVEQIIDRMLDLEIPRLLMQPIVENSVLHGLDPDKGQLIISIIGEIKDSQCVLTLQDNGRGMSDEDIEAFHISLERSLEERGGCGTWNVHQRLKLLYGDGSGLSLSRTPGGGVTAVMRWNLPDVSRKG